MPDMTKDAGAAAPAFVLRDLKAADVWQLVRVLRRFNLKEAVKLINQDTLKASQFKTPTKMVDGEIVPMPVEEWTNAQRKAYRAAQAANDELIWQILDILINNIGGCEDDLRRRGYFHDCRRNGRPALSLLFSRIFLRTVRIFEKKRRI